MRRWDAGEFELIVSEGLLAELEQALGTPKIGARVDSSRARRFVAGLRAEATLASDPAVVAERSADPADDYLIALAEAEQAVLVSGDRHLLDLADRFPIQTPRAFLDSLSEPE
jgi:predicted nucleic acid-binding protein